MSEEINKGVNPSNSLQKKTVAAKNKIKSYLL